MSLRIVYELDAATGLLVGSVPGIPDAHTQGTSIGEVRTNLGEVLELLWESNNTVRKIGS